MFKSEEKAADVALFACDGAMLKGGRNVAHVRTVDVQKWVYEWGFRILADIWYSYSFCLGSSSHRSKRKSEENMLETKLRAVFYRCKH